VPKGHCSQKNFRIFQSSEKLTLAGENDQFVGNLILSKMADQSEAGSFDKQNSRSFDAKLRFALFSSLRSTIF
jgi:hypothetical protein